MSNGSGDSSQADQSRKKKSFLCVEVMLNLDSCTETHFFYPHSILMTYKRNVKTIAPYLLFPHNMKQLVSLLLSYRFDFISSNSTYLDTILQRCNEVFYIHIKMKMLCLKWNSSQGKFIHNSTAKT